MAQTSKPRAPGNHLQSPGFLTLRFKSWNGFLFQNPYPLRPDLG
jgi:hypothetical protein